MNVSNEAKTVGYLVAVIEGEVFETNDVHLDDTRYVTAGGKRKDSGKSTYIEIPKSTRPGTYNIGGTIIALYNHGDRKGTWYAESGTITVDVIEMEREHHIKYKFDFVAVEPQPGGRRFRLSGAAELKGLWNENKKTNTLDVSGEERFKLHY